MSLSSQQNVWVILFEQTPLLIRWILTILTAGLYLLLQRLYLNHKDRVNRLELLIITMSKRIDINVNNLHKKIDTLTLSILNK